MRGYVTAFLGAVVGYAAVKFADHLVDLDGKMQALADWLRTALGMQLRREVTISG